MGEQPTEQSQPGDELTSELCVDGPTYDSGVYDGQPLTDSAPQPGDFEHRRIVSITRQRLFGRGRPLRIGRYHVERRLGTGGMGEVYLAHDEDLDRKVAVKRVLATATSERAQDRLRREARALARLSHPNVVGVYEVGEHEGRTFVAMEYVDGRTLAEWLGEGDERVPRSWRSVLEVFLAAGRGLAAAHEAGLVHRDIKPENVLISRDGDIRVADFGLVLAGERNVAEEPVDLQNLPAPARMSATGAIRGTIRYMSLEQLRGVDVDARSDQFSFCVALYEALWDVPPFSLATSLARLTDLQAGEPRPPRSGEGRRPPAALWRVIRRGLARDPQERWPDMNALLAALEHAARRRRRIAWIGSAAAAATLAIGALVVSTEPEPDPCAAIERELEGTWDDSRRAQLRGLLEASGVEAGHVGESLERVITGLDRWSAGWVDEREQVCRAEAGQRVEAELGRLQQTCLTRQRQRVEDLVEFLAQPSTDGDVLASAVEAVAELPPASACQDELALLGVEPPAPGIVDEVEALRRDIARAHELRLLGRVEEGLELAEVSEEAARALGYGPLHAEALAERAKGEFAAGSLERGATLMMDAIDACEVNHHDHLAAELWTDLTLRQLIELRDVQAGTWALRRAETTNKRVSASIRAQARLTFARGQLAELRGDHSTAEVVYRRAIEMAEDDERASLDVPSYLSNLSRVVGADDPEAAIEILRVALEAAQRQYGQKHPQTASIAYDLALGLRRVDGNDPHALELLEQVVEVWTTSQLRPGPRLARAELLLGALALRDHDLDRAEAHAQRLMSLQDEALPEFHVSRGESAHLLGLISGMRGNHASAVQYFNVALDVWAETYSLDNAGVQRVYVDLASTQLAMEAFDAAEETLDTIEPHLDSGPEKISAQVTRCELALQRGQLDEARRLARLIDPEAVGDYEFSYLLLRVLLGVRSGQLDQEAQALLPRARESTRFEDKQIRRWLEQLGVTKAERELLHLN